MKLIIFAFSAIFAAAFFDISSAATNKVVCYYGSWAVYRPGEGKFDVDDIDPNLCTHAIYTFVGVGSKGTVKILDPWRDLDDDYGLGGFRKFNELRNKNPNLKTLIAIGGWNEGAGGFSRVTGNPTLRANFVRSILEFVRKYKFDGFDIDWEYPANSERGGRPEDVENFSLLCKELHEAFQPYNLLLSAAVAAAKPAIVQYYDIPEISKYLDFINVMAYDLHGSWDGATGENAPLYASSKDSSPYLNVKNCIESWIALGAPPQKLILGMGTYGRSYTLANPNNHGIGAATVGDGAAGPITEEMGMLGYNEIVVKLLAGEMTEVWNDEQKVPYAYAGNQWVGYDDERSIALKCQFAKQMNLGGAMTWSIETDDFLGKRGTKFSLMKTINRELGRNV